MDVPVITQLLIQLSFVEYVEVPQTQFSDRVVASVASQRQVRSANCAVLGLVGTPVVVQRQVLGFDRRKLWRPRSCSALTR